MVSAEQGQIVQISRPPRIQSKMWCRSHQLGGWVQPGKRASGVSGDRAMVWPGEASRRVLPNASGMPFRSMMVGQISASSAIRRS